LAVVEMIAAIRMRRDPPQAELVHLCEERDNPDALSGHLDAEAPPAWRGTIDVAEEIIDVFFQNDLRWGGDEYDHAIAMPDDRGWCGSVRHTHTPLIRNPLPARTP